MEIVEKIRSLGCKIKNEIDSSDEKSIKVVESKYEVKFPSDYIFLTKELGDFDFTVSIMSKSICQIPNITIENDLVPVGRFLSWGKKAGSIEGILEMYSDQLPNRFVPFAEGESGDFIGFAFKSETEYNVSYWYHEGLLGMDEYVIAYSFEEFIHSLIEYEIDLGSYDNLEKIKHVGPSPKMIALLKKTGKWKGD